MRFIKSFGVLPLISVGLTWFLYGGGLGLPFYSDDLLQIPFMQATPWFQFWYTAGPYGDYRPLHFTLWRLFYWIVGPANPTAFHALNLAGHVTCGLLVGLLAARREAATSWFAAACTAIFIAFPFAFDSVLWVSSFSYPLVTALAVGAVALYLYARTHNAPRLYIVVVAITMLAGFAFEGGIVAGAAILLAELTLAPRPFSRWAIAGLVASVIPFTLIVLFTTGSSGQLSLLPPIENILAAVQAITFPVAPLAMRAQVIGLSPLLVLSIIGLLTLFGVGYLLHRTKQFNWFLFGLGWVALWSAIPILTQEYNWMRDPLRVFYPSAVGIAIIWSLVIEAPRKWPLQATLAAIVIIPAALFVQSRTALYDLAGKPFVQAVDLSARYDTTLLFINLPGRITPNDRWYPLGHEGPILMPPPNQLSDMVLVNRGQVRDVLERSAGNILPPLDITIEPAGEPVTIDDIRTADQVGLVSYDTHRVMLNVIGSVEGPTSPQPPIARFGKSILLVAATCHTPSTSSEVEITFRWQLIDSVSGQLTVFVHIIDASNEVSAQADGDPLYGLYPFSQWQVGEIVNEVRRVKHSGEGAMAVNIGIWEPASGTRWEAFDDAGNPLPDSVFHFTCQ